jgi:hypothetical protein
MKNGICVVAIGLGDAVKNSLLGFCDGAAALRDLWTDLVLTRARQLSLLFQIGQR